MRIPVTPVSDPDLPTAFQPDDRPGCGEARTAERALPLIAIDIDARLSGLTAWCRLRQRFTNPTEQPAEVTYVFPLPNRGAVTAMTATLGGRRVEGRLLERGRARQSYEDALAAGQRASLAEKDRPDVFTVTLGNLRPGEDAEVELDLVYPLEVDDGEATFRFPLVVAPRYTSGVPLDVDAAGGGLAADTDAVPDASRVTPPRLRPDDRRPELRGRVVIDDAGLGLTGWRSSLHTLTVDDGAFHLERGERLDRDLILRANLPRDRFVTAAVAVSDPEGPEGTWMVSIVPPSAGAAQAPRDVVVLLDRSGSMAGWKLVAARRAAARLVDSLAANDRFAVLAFDNILESPATALTAATDRNRFAAIRWLANLEARGGTELGMALGGASELVGEAIAGRARSLVLITDGQVSGEDAVVTAVSRHLDGVTVHCVGIDQAVNAGLLDRLARRSGGRLELVESEDRLDECLVRVGRAVNPPVLTDVEVTIGGAEPIAGTITPPVRDAVAGIPLVIAGRYRATSPADPLTLVLHAGGPGSAALPAQVTAAPEETPAVAVLWPGT